MTEAQQGGQSIRVGRKAVVRHADDYPGVFRNRSGVTPDQHQCWRLIAVRNGAPGRAPGERAGGDKNRRLRIRIVEQAVPGDCPQPLNDVSAALADAGHLAPGAVCQFAADRLGFAAGARTGPRNYRHGSLWQRTAAEDPPRRTDAAHQAPACFGIEALRKMHLLDPEMQAAARLPAADPDRFVQLDFKRVGHGEQAVQHPRQISVGHTFQQAANAPAPRLHVPGRMDAQQPRDFGAVVARRERQRGVRPGQ